MPGLSDKKTAGPAPASRAAGRAGFRLQVLAAFLAACFLITGAWAASAPQKTRPSQSRSAAPGKAATAARGPVAVLTAFDSLIEAGNLPAARALCTGQVLRMFDFLAMAHARMADLVDSARSREDTLADSVSGDWAYVKMASHVVFRRPFLGQTEMKSVQAIHLWKSPRGWLVAEFQELEKAGDPVAFRSGRPPDPGLAPDSAGKADGGRPGTYAASADSAAASLSATPGFFPVSPKAPERSGQADWLRYRLRLRNGGRLAELCPLDDRQRRVQEVSASEWILENSLPVLPRTRGRKGMRSAKGRPDSLGSSGTRRMEPPPDSLLPYLASNAYLILDDSLLQAAAAQAAGSAADPIAKADSIRRWVSGGLRFRLGAVLFGTSREVLRDMTGDCSEAAILTAALLRASGIPSRVALGFASAGRGVFIGHAWTEAWLGIGPGWVGVDAALGQYPAGVERIKLLHLDGRADMRIAATNLMLAALFNLDIEILAAREGGRPLKLIEHPGAVEEGAGFFSEILRGLEEEVKVKNEK